MLLRNVNIFMYCLCLLLEDSQCPRPVSQALFELPVYSHQPKCNYPITFSILQISCSFPLKYTVLMNHLVDTFIQG